MGTPPIPARIYGNQNGVEIKGCAGNAIAYQETRRAGGTGAEKASKTQQGGKWGYKNVTLERVHEYHPQ